MGLYTIMTTDDISKGFHQEIKHRKVRNTPCGIPTLSHREEEEDPVKDTE